MSQPWKLLPFAAIVVAVGALLLAPGGAARPDAASAAFNCDTKQVLTIRIADLDDGLNPIKAAGASVNIQPNPNSGTGTLTYVDNGNNDDNNAIGTISEDQACTTTGDSEYTVTLLGFPNAFTCEIVIGGSPGVKTTHTSNATLVELYVRNCVYNATATPTGTVTVTGTAGPAATVTTSASPGSVSCSGTSIVTIQVRDAQGRAVQAGTAVTIASSIGTVSPSSGQTTDASGSAFVFFTAPPSTGGTATITAISGSAQGSTTVTVNCGTATPTATTAPPPTVAPGGGGIITPPSTGSAGLAGSNGNAWLPFASMAFVAAVVLGATGIVKARA